MTAAGPVRSWPDRVPGDKRTLGYAVLAWTADYLTQPDGPMAGEPWEFTREQVRIVLRWYQIDAHGKFCYRRGVLRRMKGWGKDPFLAAIAGVELCGPCRFGGWGRGGMPVAVQHPAPWIQVAAVSKDQTRNTMTLFPGMFSKDAVDEYKIDLGKEIIYARGNGRLEAVTSSPRALEGGRPSLVIANETHHWLTSNEGLEMSEAIKRNLGKSRDGAARVMEITNAHLPGEGSAAELTYDAWKQSGGKLAGVYYDSVEASPIGDIGDLPAVRRGLVAARGDSVWVDVDRLVEEIADPVTPESISRRFYLNQVFKADMERWIPTVTWATLKGEPSIPDGSRVVLGLDGSYNGDSTAVVAALCGPEPHVAVVGCWEADPSDPDWTVPVLDVEDAIRAACKRWKVREVVCDPYRWQRTMAVLADERLPIVEFPQSPQRMVPATSRFYEAVMNRKMTHDGDQRLARHIANCVAYEDSRGRRIRKETKWSSNRIDLAIAAVMAFFEAANEPGATPAQAWLEEMAPDVVAPPADAPPAPDVEPEPSATWTPWGQPSKQQGGAQTAATLQMLRKLGGVPSAPR